MSDSKSRPARRPAAGARHNTVGGPERSSHFPAVFIVSVVAVVLAFVVLLTVAADAFSGDDKAAPPIATPTEAPPTANSAAPTSTASQVATKTQAPTPGPDGSIIVPCGDILAPVDKQHRLTRDCVPSDMQQLPSEFASGFQQMRRDAAAAFIALAQAAKVDGYAIYSNSSYRSFDEQAATYDYWVANSGKEYADRSSARAGHSEHQLGTTTDVGAGGKELEAFAGTPEAKWLAENATRFGFIISYPDGKEAITGYIPEAWHIRWVGKDAAQKVKDSGLTLHEYLLK